MLRDSTFNKIGLRRNFSWIVLRFGNASVGTARLRVRGCWYFETDIELEDHLLGLKKNKTSTSKRHFDTHTKIQTNDVYRALILDRSNSHYSADFKVY